MALTLAAVSSAEASEYLMPTTARNAPSKKKMYAPLPPDLKLSYVRIFVGQDDQVHVLAKISKQVFWIVQRDGCPKIVNLGSAKIDLFYERKKYGFKKR